LAAATRTCELDGKVGAALLAHPRLGEIVGSGGDFDDGFLGPPSPPRPPTSRRRRPGLQLVVGVEVTEPGVARAQVVEVSYRVGTKHHREVYTDEIYLCAPKADFPDGCINDDVRGNFDDGVAEWSADTDPDGILGS